MSDRGENGRFVAQTETLVIGLSSINLTRTQQRIANLICASDNGISSDQLLNKLYAHRRDGGPLTAQTIIHVYVCKINKKLRPFGMRIHCRGWGGGEYGTYQLYRTNFASSDALRFWL